jgi:hypothetical protein
MSPIFAATLAAAALLAIVTVSTFNRLVRRRNGTQNAFGALDAKGRTLVLPVGQTPQAVPSNRGLVPVSLESPELSAVFSAYAADPVEARYVLTPKTMERLVELARIVRRPIHAAFDRQRVVVAMDNGKGAFEALAFGGEKAWDEIRGFAGLSGAARSIVEELDALLSHGSNANWHSGADHKTTLQIAVDENDRDVASALVDGGACVTEAMRERTAAKKNEKMIVILDGGRGSCHEP